MSWATLSVSINVFQMLVNIYCNEIMDMGEDVCCSGPPKPTEVQLFLLNFFILLYVFYILRHVLGTKELDN